MRIPNWYRVENDGVRFYQAWNLRESGLVTHGYSTRIGGVSFEPYDTLNLGLGVDDNADNVRENRRRFGNALDMDPVKIIVPKQTHSANVRIVGVSEVGAGALDYESGIADTDALITNTPGVTLAMHFADCVCVFLLDPVNKAIGLVHSGWKGTVAKILTRTIEAMGREFGSSPDNMRAAIAPAIGRCCYEVSEDVARQIFKAFPHDERVLNQSSSTKWRADLKIANNILLHSAGIKDSNVAISEECTSCNREEFYSYRRDGETGRMAGWISLNK